MNPEAIFVVGMCVLAACALVVTGLGLVIAGYAIKGLITGTGVRYELAPIIGEITDI